MSHSKDTRASIKRIASTDMYKPQVKTEYKEHENQKLGVTLGSKLNSQKTSLKASKVSFNKDLKIDYPEREVKQSYCTTRNTTKQYKTEGNNCQVNGSHTSVVLIS